MGAGQTASPPPVSSARVVTNAPARPTPIAPKPRRIDNREPIAVEPQVFVSRSPSLLIGLRRPVRLPLDDRLPFREAAPASVEAAPESPASSGTNLSNLVDALPGFVRLKRNVKARALFRHGASRSE